MRTVGEEEEQAPFTDGGSKMGGMFVLCSFHVMMMPFHSWLHDLVLFYLFFSVFVFQHWVTIDGFPSFWVEARRDGGAKGKQGVDFFYILFYCISIN